MESQPALFYVDSMKCAGWWGSPITPGNGVVEGASTACVGGLKTSIVHVSFQFSRKSLRNHDDKLVISKVTSKKIVSKIWVS